MLLDTDLTQNQRDFVETIKRSGDNLLSLINDILDFSKIEAGELDFEKTDFEPERIAYDVCELMLPKLESKPVEILCRIEENLPPLINGDPLRFQQVIMNLMGNSVKFTESGEIELYLYMENESDSRVKLHAVVRDTGIGISEDKLSAVFSPFKQADGSTTRKYGGTGLGLSICKQISNKMGGDVWAESLADFFSNTRDNQNRGEFKCLDTYRRQLNRRRGGPRSGTIFHFTAWFEKVHVHSSAKPTPPALANRRILVVDDNRIGLNILTDLLTSAGMSVTASEKGDMVLPLLQQPMTNDHPIELCIIDTHMPGTNPFEIAKKIRNFESSESANQRSIRNLPLIALIDLPKHNKRQYKDAVFDGFIRKPVRKEKLYRMLESAVNRGNAEGSGQQRKDLSIQNHGKSPYEVKIENDRLPNILLAEDNPINQKLAEMMLVKAGYQVETATTGKEAFETYIASSGNFDLILMDMQMPEMDGIEATRLIRNWEEQNQRRVPIVALTANAIKGDKEKCIEGGMDDFITKPIDRDLFFDVIEKQLACK